MSVRPITSFRGATTIVPRRADAIACGLVLLATTCGIASADPTTRPVSGEPLKVTHNGGVGPLAVPDGLTSVPIGAADIFGGARPDLFVSSPRGKTQAFYLYQYLRDADDGRPIFAAPVEIASPLGKGGPADGSMYVADDGAIYFLATKQKSVARFRFDRATKTFAEAGEVALSGLPAAADSVAVVSSNSERVTLAVSVSAGGKGFDGDRKSPLFSAFDGEGLYRGEWNYQGVYRVDVDARSFAHTLGDGAMLWTRSPREVRQSMAIVCAIGAGDRRGLLATAQFGNVYYFPVDAAGRLGERRLVTDASGVVIRHPSTGVPAVAYPSRDGRSTDFIGGGEGALAYYRATGSASADGTPTFDAPTPVWQQDALLYGGSLAIPTAVDLDGDGAVDLVVGNSEGRILFFKNHGTTAVPRFGVGEPLKAAGREIEIQQGYWSVQSNAEVRWGYACPNVYDWDGDGLPDLLVGSAVQEQFFFRNVGTKAEPKFDAPRALLDEGIYLVGLWRTRPGVARMGERVAYVTEDAKGFLSRYWRVDDANVMRDGPMRLTTGEPISIPCADMAPGQKGRPTIELADWDGDGRLDCFIGTSKFASIPEPENGLPYVRRKIGGKALNTMQVVYLRNAGTDAEPRYEYPRQLTFRGNDFYLGSHISAAVATPLGGGDKPNLLIGNEAGRIYFYAHDDITFAPRPATTRPSEARAD